MEFVNAAAAGAGFLNTTFGRDHMLAAVIARPAFRIEGEQLVPTPDLEWPVGREPVVTPFGTFPADLPFLTGGIDLFVLGTVWQPDAAPRGELTVEIRLGPRLLRRIAVYGDRRWVRKNGSLVPGPAAPFVSMPLSWDRAFGGSAESEPGRCPWPANPGGVGFYLSEREAEGRPLANLEDPEHPIFSIEDRPDPMATGPYPADGSLRVQNAVDLDLDPENPGIRRIKPLVFNHAHPRLILEPADTPPPGTVFEVTNASSRGSLRFLMPELAFHAHVHLEHRNYFFPLHLDQILVLLDEARVVLGYRVVFQYRLAKGERRRAMLRQGPVPEGQSANTQI